MEKYQVIVILILVILIMAVVKIRYGNKDSEQLTVNSEQKERKITPTVIPNNDYPLEKELPYYGKGFVVEKYTAPKTLKMILNGATETEASNEVTKWINSFGEAIGVHKIVISEQ